MDCGLLHYLGLLTVVSVQTPGESKVNTVYIMDCYCYISINSIKQYWHGYKANQESYAVTAHTHTP